MIIDYVNRTKKHEVESAGDAIKAGFCAAFVIVTGNGFIDDVNGWDFYNSDNNPVDDNGHGSHVGGIIAALSDNEQGGSGIAPDSELIPIKVLNSDGGGSTIDYVFQKVAQGIRYAVQIGAQVINMSLSYATSGISSLVVQDVQDAILEAHTAGVVVVVAYRDWETDRKSTRLNSSHITRSRMPSSA